MSKWVAAAALLLVATGCGFGNEARSCTSNAECNSVEHPGGVCEASTHLCSFPDTSCPDGFRYGGLAGDQSNQCVPGPGQGSNPIADAAIDSKPPIDTAPPIDSPPDAQVCFGTGIVKVCLASAPTGDLTSLGGTLDTTNSPLCAPLVSGGDLCVIAATTITVQTALRAIGTKPLVLLASDTITTNAPIDVASHRVAGADELGAGADPVGLCSAGTAPQTANGSSGGGAGGSFTGGGGNGGAGSDVNTAKGGAGGVAGTANIIVTQLRGGCPGQKGAAAASADAGAAGHGGGAIFLLAGTSITAQQTINASGEGGGGGIANVSGGGGGGTGGLIGFDAPTVVVNGLILANGGGGGEGSREATGTGSAGGNGGEATSVAAAAGGGIIAFGGDGGSGSSGAAAGAGVSGIQGAIFGSSRGGGGGGGGGAGYVVASQGAAFFNGVSPAQTIPAP